MVRRKRLLCILITVMTLFFCCVLNYFHTQMPIVLMYHAIMEQPATENTSLFLKPTDFEAQISWLAENGYRFLFADEYAAHKGKSAIITFDDGYADNWTTVRPILEKYRAKATVYVVTDLIGRDGYLTQEQIREMADSGYYQIGSHTTHHMDLTTLSNRDAAAELEDSFHTLSSLTGSDITSVSYPYGNYDWNILSTAKKWYQISYTTQHGETGTPFVISRYNIVRDMPLEKFISLIS